MKNKVILWLKVIRPGTLAAAVTPVLVALFFTSQQYTINLPIAIITLLTALCIQIASNLINDYYDFKKGLDKAGRLGPSRALAENLISIRAMQYAIGIDLAITILCGIYLIYIGGLAILIIGIVALLCAWLYTATPYSLSYLGIADLFVLIFFGPVATLGTAYLQTGEWSINVGVLGLVNGFISMAVLTVNNIRDRETDVTAGKRSLIVRCGKTFGEIEYLMLFILIAPCLYYINSGICNYAVIIYGVCLYLKLRKTSGREYNKMLILTGMANIVFTIFFALDVYLI